MIAIVVSTMGERKRGMRHDRSETQGPDSVRERREDGQRPRPQVLDRPRRGRATEVPSSLRLHDVLALRGLPDPSWRHGIGEDDAAAYPGPVPEGRPDDLDPPRRAGPGNPPNPGPV